MKYIRGTRDIPLILSANVSGVLKWWIYVSYAVHSNMRGHTGGGFSREGGFPTVTLTKQKLSTRSSNESEIVVIHDCRTAVFWRRCFMETQVYQVTEKLSTKTTKAPFSWRRMGSHQVSSAPSTLIIFSFS